MTAFLAVFSFCITLIYASASDLHLSCELSGAHVFLFLFGKKAGGCSDRLTTALRAAHKEALPPQHFLLHPHNHSEQLHANMSSHSLFCFSQTGIKQKKKQVVGHSSSGVQERILQQDGGKYYKCT